MNSFLRGTTLLFILGSFWLILAAGCLDDTQFAGIETVTSSAELQPTSTNAAASPQIDPDTGWSMIKRGLESRAISLISEEGALSEYILLTRLDPEFYRFEVGYQPAEPMPLQNWLQQTGAAMAINGGFFTEENRATGLVISGGESSGTSYEGFGGMFAVTPAGADLRVLESDPYLPEENLLHAVQSFPILVRPGADSGYDNGGEDKARRSAVGIDRQGRIVFLAAGIGSFTLNELSQFLIESDLDLETALNLDGGASSGLLISENSSGIPSFSLLPTVILAFER